MARSRVAPKHSTSIPCLELCAALTGAQLSKLLHSEMSLSPDKTFIWSDSTTVLSWLKSESHRYKVFVANHITEIIELTQLSPWRYFDSQNNPADDMKGNESERFGCVTKVASRPFFPLLIKLSLANNHIQWKIR